MKLSRTSALFVLLTGLVVMVGVGCRDEKTTGGGATSTLRVVTTTALLADMAKTVGGALVDVRSIVPAGADVHSFQPSPGDSIAISDAKLIISNGGGLDDDLMSLLKSAKRTDAVHVILTEKIASAPSSQSLDDPHYWQNPSAATIYVDQILVGLVTADSANADAYRVSASEYIDEINAMDREISEILEEVPKNRRHLIIFHDSFGHFANRYGWQVTALVPSHAGEVTPARVASVIELIKDHDIPTVFAEPQFSSKFLEEIARESGAKVATMYSDTLDDTVPTYIDMMKFNASSLAGQLR